MSESIEVGDRVTWVRGKYHFTGKVDSLHLNCSSPWAGILVYGSLGNVVCWNWQSIDRLTKLAPAAAEQEQP